jgi:3-deoxy-D-manno-octulosonic-acid transferase
MLYLKKRGQKNPAYNYNWHERFGLQLKNPATKPIIWLHSVSVGETRAMQKLILLLEEYYPNYQILITNMTPTGKNTAMALYPNAITHYIPYDLPHAVINFYTTFKPQLGLIMETEIWPNLTFYAHKFSIPLYLINARLSNKSFSSYNKIRYLIKPILNKFSAILCQDQNSLANFAALGFKPELTIIGNMKFDLSIQDNFNFEASTLKKDIPHKPTVIFASTRDGDEKLILDNLPANLPYLVIIVPRHPERFVLVEKLIQEKKLKYQKRTDLNKPQTPNTTDHYKEIIAIKPDTQIFLGNTLGEMLLYYKIADLAVIGGSFSNHGGQNLIEAIFMHKPVLFGSSMFNFKEVAANAKAHHCAIEVTDINDCFIQIDNILADKNRYLALVDNCQNFIHTYQGASQLVLNHVAKHLNLPPLKQNLRVV